MNKEDNEMSFNKFKKKYGDPNTSEIELKLCYYVYQQKQKGIIPDITPNQIEELEKSCLPARSHR